MKNLYFKTRLELRQFVKLNKSYKIQDNGSTSEAGERWEAVSMIKTLSLPEGVKPCKGLFAGVKRLQNVTQKRSKVWHSTTPKIKQVPVYSAVGRSKGGTC